MDTVAESREMLGRDFQKGDKLIRYTGLSGQEGKAMTFTFLDEEIRARSFLGIDLPTRIFGTKKVTKVVSDTTGEEWELGETFLLSEVKPHS